MGGSTSLGGLPLFAAGQPHPEYAYWLVRTVDCEGEGLPSQGTSGMIAYERACLTVTYGPPDWNNLDPALVGDEELDYSSTAIALGNVSSAFKWTSGANNGNDVPATMVPAINLTTVSFTKTQYRVPVLNSATIMSLIDHVNSTAFFGAAAEKVVYRGARTKREITALGDRNWTVQHRFEFNSLGWNNLIDGANGAQSFTYKGGSKLFPTGNLNSLFS
jgi:hypothetical protein